MIIDSHNTSGRTLIIAEIGNNHEGSMDVARELVRKVAGTGADAVKFQTFLPDHYVSRQLDPERHQRLGKFQLSIEQFSELAELAHGLGLIFISTPFDLRSADGLVPLVDAFKIASGDNTFYPLLVRVASKGKPVLLSTGLADLETVRRAHDLLCKNLTEEQIAILHCVSNYPVAPENANLAAMQSMRRTFRCEIGYSDHTDNAISCLLAVALGARVIEKHFTLSRSFSTFRDHILSDDPEMLSALVKNIRLTESLLGHGEKRPAATESAIEKSLRRSIAADHDLAKGTVLSWEHLTWVRPGNGIAAGSEEEVLGKRLTRNVEQGELFKQEHWL